MRINYDLHDLQAFVAVAQRASFRQAAADLFLSQSALSRRIDKLEDSLGVKLFERTTRRVQLTNVGQTFLVNVRTALDGLEDAVLGVADLAAHRTGSVTLACVPSAVWHFLPDVLARFSERFPRIRVRVHDESAQDVLNLVLAGVADFGINFTGAENPEIEFEPIYVESYVLAMRSSHPLAGRKELSWKETMNERYISVATSSGNRTVIDAALAGVEKHPVILCEVNHVSGVLALVEAGMGVAAVPGLSVLPGRQDTIVGVPLVNPAIHRTLGLIAKRNHTMAPAARTLFDMLREALVKPQ
ncbi:MAG TPA: LysR substrate-binding domain-containing protein [Roseateles sp.]|uniref:LysR family transcriptional regulator n=1 Tax=Massilia cellulosiltytica TaxID=2683234 RepID=A0A7X3KB22_9BURK|nr:MULTISPECIES: LysR family transcriptional regulator [Telluria group]KQY00883.1 LysR family transcriptional regulator [Massilia sp. Root133]KQZ53089.1 LysR family transcriptional regulator [Massilia sp. Root1485]MVW63646.1 LysR family transcriptional regulator [Telluria cellulosilytica]HEU6456298.1 LysR substrate-binding domain-containing protein [Roseateles sp.]